MKKNIFFISFTILVLILTSFNIASAASKKMKKNITNARVIFVAGDYIELKKGKTEFKVSISDKTSYIKKDGIDGDKNIIEVCQYVNAFYTVQAGNKELDKIIIIKESDCVK